MRHRKRPLWVNSLNTARSAPRDERTCALPITAQGVGPLAHPGAWKQFDTLVDEIGF